ncbi:DUF7281 domain-containing protein [Pseudomonas sp. 7-41]|nr:hypothetical protein [Pseudomonas sp. 7-41]UHG95146.1 hypothetical protein LQ249_15625 [Pseudomonas sp. 7-41]
MSIFTTRRSITPIVKAIRQHATKVQLNATWSRLHSDYGIGTKFGSSSLALSEGDLHTLRVMLQRDAGIDALHQSLGELEGDRIDTAKKSRNEKLARLRTADRVVMVASLSGQLELASGIYRHPIGGSLNVPAEELHGSERVLLVENLAVMFAIHEYRWPDEVKRLPMLFRGSPQNTAAAVTKALAGVTDVICFPDYDPQGWMNTLTIKARGIVVPTMDAIECIIAEEWDKPQDYERQHVAREWLRRIELPQVEDLLTRELAISQESMAGMGLEVLDLCS